MKSLYMEKYFTYTEEATELDREASEIIEPLIKKWMKMGYNPYEVAQIIENAISRESTFLLAYRNLALRKEEIEQKDKDNTGP